MVCTEGIATLLHFRSIRCYYFLLCMAQIDLPSTSYFLYLLYLCTQEAKGNNFTSNKGLAWRPRPCHYAVCAVRLWRDFDGSLLGCGEMCSIFTQT